MPTVRCEGHDYIYPVSDVLRMFFGSVGTTPEGFLTAGSDLENVIHSRLSETAVSTWLDGGIYIAEEEKMPGLPPKREVKRQLYLILSRLLNRTYPWGSLTGIRPTLVARESGSAAELINNYFVRPDKAELACSTAAFEDRILAAVPKDSICVYIGIPFCRSRCAYCSFISQDASSHLELLSPYAEAVVREIGAFSRGNPPDISCLYVGGGTPTVFDDITFCDFMEKTFRLLGADRISEITVEAGRPDTISEKKLRLLRDLGVRRICINPQTLSDRTLLLLGRKHTAEEFFGAYNLARKLGFETINTDLIAGLPEETEDDFVRSLEGILDLKPENITVHTLSKKKKSSMARGMQMAEDREVAEVIDRMVTNAHRRLHEKGYGPYYLYRQKDTAGGHENTGFTLPGHECVYNVAMMSDERSVLAFGAGGMSKRIFENRRLERCPCVRDPQEYIRRAEEMAEKKREFLGLYGV